MNKYNASSLTLEPWEIVSGLTLEVKAKAFNEVHEELQRALKGVSEYFEIDLSMANYEARYGNGDVFEVEANINNHEDHLEPNNIYLYLRYTETEGVIILMGEDNESEFPLTTGDLFVIMYCQSFAKPE